MIDFTGTTEKKKGRRGFASWTLEKRREVAAKGGRAAHAKGTAHEFNAQEASAAGKKGGISLARNRAHMAAIGRRGGAARGETMRRRKLQQDARDAVGASPIAIEGSTA